jgi:phospholipase C
LQDFPFYRTSPFNQRHDATWKEEKMKGKANTASSLGPLVDHVVIIVKENHTYDNYFGTFPNSEGDKKLGKAQMSVSPHHDHKTWMNRAADHRYEVQYSEAEIPTYFALARQYTLCDHFFSEVGGPSTPSHLMLITADSPLINNPTPFSPTPTNLFDLNSLPMALQNKGLTWGNYGGYAFHYIRELAAHPENHTRDLFVHHAAAGQLPSVSWVYGDGKPEYSEHPPQNITAGSEWTGQQIQAIVDGGLWPRTVVFVTWDDWGGWYDHVVPPNVEKWDSKHAQYPSDAHPEFDGDQFRYGSRVPCLVISPYARQGHVSQTQRSHISLVKFCQTLFGLPSINPRLDTADDMADCFDPTQAPLAPPKLPPPTALGGGRKPVPVPPKKPPKPKPAPKPKPKPKPRPHR